MKIFDSQSFQWLSHALDASSLRQRVIANNIANVDTPGYKSKEVIFEQELRKALEQRPSGFVGKRTHPLHLPIDKNERAVPAARVAVSHQTWVQNNGNNVDIEYEMTKLAQNQIWYNALVDRTNGYFNSLREVIKEGR